MEIHGSCNGCPLHGTLAVVHDATVPENIQKGVNDQYSLCTLPDDLSIKKSNIPFAGVGVFATKFSPARTRFGPYGGVKEKNTGTDKESLYRWQIFNKGQPSHFVIAKDPSSANWMRYVNFVHSEGEHNLTAFQCEGEIYFSTNQPILAGSELLVDYDGSYAQEMNHAKQSADPVKNQATKKTDDPKVNEFTVEGTRNHEHGIFSRDISISKEIHLDSHKKRTRRGVISVLPLPATHPIPLEMDTGCHTDQQKDESQVIQERIKVEGDESWKDQLHASSHRGEKPFKCDSCDKAFATSSSLQRHNRIHTAEKPHTCDVCGKGFAVLFSLNLHIRTHTGEKPCKCEVCGTGFTRSSDLRKHRRTHTGEKPYECDVCGKEFRRSNDLHIHKRKHTGEKPYGCDVCGKGFSASGSLRKHKRTHTGERPYECDQCGKGFAVSSSLFRHVRSHATDEKPHECSECHKGFSESTQLKKHMRIHAGDKPYKCDTCGKRFCDSSNFRRHKQTHIDLVNRKEAAQVHI